MGDGGIAVAEGVEGAVDVIHAGSRLVRPNVEKEMGEDNRDETETRGR